MAPRQLSYIAESYDFFVAHAGPDADVAERLFDLLVPESQVFLDTKCLQLGDDWDQVLPEAQLRSRITVVLVSRKTDAAFYQREEIARAIALARNGALHKVVPIFLEPRLTREPPYGLRVKHGLVLERRGGWAKAARRLLELNRIVESASMPNLNQDAYEDLLDASPQRYKSGLSENNLIIVSASHNIGTLNDLFQVVRRVDCTVEASSQIAIAGQAVMTLLLANSAESTERLRVACEELTIDTPRFVHVVGRSGAREARSVGAYTQWTIRADVSSTVEGTAQLLDLLATWGALFLGMDTLVTNEGRLLSRLQLALPETTDFGAVAAQVRHLSEDLRGQVLEFMPMPQSGIAPATWLPLSRIDLGGSTFLWASGASRTGTLPSVARALADRGVVVSASAMRTFGGYLVALFALATAGRKPVEMLDVVGRVVTEFSLHASQHTASGYSSADHEEVAQVLHLYCVAHEQNRTMADVTRALAEEGVLIDHWSSRLVGQEARVFVVESVVSASAETDVRMLERRIQSISGLMSVSMSPIVQQLRI